MMSALVGPVVVREFVRKLRGGSQSILVKASDDLQYVLKFQTNPQGPNLLFNEALGSELYRICGLPTPKWKPLLVTDEFLDQNRACWFESPTGRVRPSAGLCFGSPFLGAAANQIWEILPGSYFGRLVNRNDFALAWLIDACARHLDNRQALFLADNASGIKAIFVDHGHMFGGPAKGCNPRPTASRYLDVRVYTPESMMELEARFDMLNGGSLWELLNTIPREWQTASALRQFSECAATLTDRSRQKKKLDCIFDEFLRSSRLAHREFQCDQSLAPAPKVLCFDVHRSGKKRRAIA